MTNEQKSAIESGMQQITATRQLAVEKVLENNTITQKNLSKYGALALNFVTKKLEKILSESKDEKSVEKLQEDLKKAEDKVKKLQEQISAITGEGDTSSIDDILSFAEGLPTVKNEYTDDVIDSVKEFAKGLGWKSGD